MYNEKNIVCIDGGLVMNNPSLGALIEVLGNTSYKHYKIEDNKLKIEDIAVLSLGTGISSKQHKSQSSKNWGRLQWIKDVIDISMGAPVNIVSDQLEAIFNSRGLRNNYLRINVEIDEKYAEMDDSRKETLEYYIKETNSKLTNSVSLMDRLKLFLIESGIEIPDD
jgi:patatin-like phospholipase/acyl hydrolase